MGGCEERSTRVGGWMVCGWVVEYGKVGKWLCGWIYLVWVGVPNDAFGIESQMEQCLNSPPGVALC